jgi:hypothetical protein
MDSHSNHSTLLNSRSTSSRPFVCSSIQNIKDWISTMDTLTNPDVRYYSMVTFIERINESIHEMNKYMSVKLEQVQQVQQGDIQARWLQPK